MNRLCTKVVGLTPTVLTDDELHSSLLGYFERRNRRIDRDNDYYQRFRASNAFNETYLIDTQCSRTELKNSKKILNPCLTGCK